MERMENFKNKTDRLVGEYIKELEEENKKLKEDYKALGILNDEIRRVNENLRGENKKLKATLDAYAKQINRLEQRLLKYEKVHDGKFVEKDITTSENKPLF